jgi:hypothetical protein
MTTRTMRKLLALGVVLGLTGPAVGEENTPAWNSPEAPAAGDAASSVSSDQHSAKKAPTRSAKSSTRNARRKGAGPQDRSARAKRHQEKMMAQSARRPSLVSKQFSGKRPAADTPANPPSPESGTGSPAP